jgi:hypothetical protein
MRAQVGVGGVLVFIALACAGSPPAADPTQPGAPVATATQGAPAATTPVDEPTVDPGSFVPGSVRYRVANLTDEPVDVYVRTQGLVVAFGVQAGLARGEVTEYVAPPDPGALLVTTAGSGAPTCVGACPHFIGSWGNTNAHGDQNTIYVYQEGGVELWENPDPADVGSAANALPPGDPAEAWVFAIGRAVSGADFGLRLGFEGVEGCQVDVNETGLLVGGTSVLPFAFDGDTEVLIYPNTDRECAGEPIGGPFAVTGGAGSRHLLLLYGSIDEMDGLVLPIR